MAAIHSTGLLLLSCLLLIDVSHEQSKWVWDGKTRAAADPTADQQAQVKRTERAEGSPRLFLGKLLDGLTGGYGGGYPSGGYPGGGYPGYGYPPGPYPYQGGPYFPGRGPYPGPYPGGGPYPPGPYPPGPGPYPYPGGPYRPGYPVGPGGPHPIRPLYPPGGPGGFPGGPGGFPGGPGGYPGGPYPIPPGGRPYPPPPFPPVGPIPPDPTAYSSCRCVHSFNCQYPRLSFGNCDYDKQYCCDNRYGLRGGLLTGPNGPVDGIRP